MKRILLPLCPFDIVEREVMREQTEFRSRIAQLEREVKSANACADMYANAWQREIATYDGTIRRKSHHIDAMVLTTRDLVEKLKAAEARIRELEEKQ
jgi:hypothetical protein